MSIRVLSDPVAALLDRIRTTQARWIVGLAGVPGSGKTTWAARVAREIQAALGDGQIMVLGMDGFHLPKAALAQMPDPALTFARRGAPWTFDRLQLAERLHALRTCAGRTAVPWPDFQHEIGDPVEAAHIIPPDVPLILVEGIYLLHRDDGWDAVTTLLDERWYLDTPPALSFERLIQRHMTAWSLTHEQAQSRANTNDRLNAELIIASRQYADYLVV